MELHCLSFLIILLVTNRKYLNISPLSIVYQSFDIFYDQGRVDFFCLLVVLSSSQVPGATGYQPKPFLLVHMRDAVAGRAAGPDQHRPDHHHRADDRPHARAHPPGLRRARHLLCRPGRSLEWGCHLCSFESFLCWPRIGVFGVSPLTPRASPSLLWQ